MSVSPFFVPQVCAITLHERTTKDAKEHKGVLYFVSLVSFVVMLFILERVSRSELFVSSLQPAP